jgi:hypothetical protein
MPMRATLTPAALLLLAMASASAAGDGLPSFAKRGEKEKEKEWVADVGEAIVKAARSGLKKIDLADYELKDVGKGRKDLRITMHLYGAVLKRFTARIVVHVDASDEKRWSALGIDYEDNIRIGKKADLDKVRGLVEKLNR